MGRPAVFPHSHGYQRCAGRLHLLQQHHRAEFLRGRNQLTITSAQAIQGSVTVKQKKISAQRSGVVVWTDGITGGGKQDFATYGETVSDSMVGYLNLEVKPAI